MAASRQRPRRTRGTGALILRADGRWIARVSIGTIDGKRRSMERWAPDEDRARDALRELLDIVGAGVDPGDPKTTLDAYLRSWLVHVKATMSAATYASYRGHVENHISPLLGGAIVRKLAPRDIRRLIRDRQAAGLASAYRLQQAADGRQANCLRIGKSQVDRSQVFHLP